MKNFSLVELEDLKLIELGRGKVISKKDLNANPGNYPVYSSAKTGGGIFGTWGNYDFNEEMITWSVDGGGDLFHRNKHKFSITNVGGFIKVLDKNKINTKYLYYALKNLHNGINFDWVKKAHPSVLRKEYNYIPVPSLQEQEKIVERLDKESALIAKRTNLNFITLINNLFSSHVNDIVKELYENSPKVAVQDEIYTSDYVANGSFKSLKDNVNTTNKPSFALLVKFNDLSKSKNLKKTYIDESSYNFLKKSNLYEGDLIINNVGANLGQVFIVPNLYKKMSIGPNCIIMRPSNNFLGEYLQIVMNSHYFQTMLREIFGGAAQPKFNKTNFRSLMLPFIDLDKQNEIVSEIKKIEEIKNKLINNQQQIYTKLLELKKSVLKKEFSYE